MKLEEASTPLARSLDDRRFSKRALIPGEFAASLEFVDRPRVDTSPFEVAARPARSAGRPPRARLAGGGHQDLARSARPPTRPAVAEAFSARVMIVRERSRGSWPTRAGPPTSACLPARTTHLRRHPRCTHRRAVAVRIITITPRRRMRFGRGTIRTVRASRRGWTEPVPRPPGFAILDGATLLTGSYNWTRGAARDNEENFIVTTDPRFLAASVRNFGRLWTKLGTSR